MGHSDAASRGHRPYDATSCPVRALRRRRQRRRPLRRRPVPRRPRCRCSAPRAGSAWDQVRAVRPPARHRAARPSRTPTPSSASPSSSWPGSPSCTSARSPGCPRRSPGRPVTVVPVTRAMWIQRRRRRLPAAVRGARRLAVGRPPTRRPRVDDPADAAATRWPPCSAPGHGGRGADDAVDDGRLDARPPRPAQLRPVRPADPAPAVRRARARRRRTSREFGEEWSLAHDDLRLWVCLHEVAHHAVLGVPHVGDEPSRACSPSTPPGSARRARRASREPAGDLSLRRPVVARRAPGDLRRSRRCSSAPCAPTRSGRCSPGSRRSSPSSIGVVDWVMDSVGGGAHRQLRPAHRGAAPPPGRGRRLATGSSSSCSASSSPRPPTTAARRSSPASSSGPAPRASSGSGRATASLPTPAEIDAPGLWLARIDLPTTDADRPEVGGGRSAL